MKKTTTIKIQQEARSRRRFGGTKLILVIVVVIVVVVSALIGWMLLNRKDATIFSTGDTTPPTVIEDPAGSTGLPDTTGKGVETKGSSSNSLN